jgi:hypothetical protein
VLPGGVEVAGTRVGKTEIVEIIVPQHWILREGMLPQRDRPCGAARAHGDESLYHEGLIVCAEPGGGREIGRLASLRGRPAPGHLRADHGAAGHEQGQERQPRQEDRVTVPEEYGCRP